MVETSKGVMGPDEGEAVILAAGACDYLRKETGGRGPGPVRSRRHEAVLPPPSAAAISSAFSSNTAEGATFPDR